MTGGRLAGIIDWSAAGIGHPACEAMLAWAMPPDARAVYRAVPPPALALAG
jgi:aminoglycoside phosphotransferase (APT) family kinase protein